MLESLKTVVRSTLWGWLGPPEAAATATAKPAPLGVDKFSNLPVHYDPPECPVCPHPDKDGRHWCSDCGGTLTNPDWPFGYGVESATVTHLHEHVVPESGGRRIRVPARRKLCIPCFRIDWPKANPNKPCDL